MADYALASDAYSKAIAIWENAVASGLDLASIDAYSKAVALWKRESQMDWSGVDSIGLNLWSLPTTDPALAPTLPVISTYKMRGMDALVDALYDTWLVTGDADTTGAHYSGPLDVPLRDIVVVDRWSDGAPPAEHGPAHENGGSQEINVSGLSGVLADAQRANKLVVPAGDMALSVVADGQFLRRRNTDFVGQHIYRSLWDPPETAHANDHEFDTPTLPASWQLWDITSSSIPAVGPYTPSGDVDAWSRPASGQVWASSNHAQRPSWLSLQGSNDNLTWFYGFKIANPSSGVFRARVRMGTRYNTGYAANQGNCQFSVRNDNGGRPHTGNVAFLSYLRGGWVTTANATLLRFMSRQSSGGVTTIDGSDLDLLNPVGDYEVVFVKPGGSTWHWFLRSHALTHYLGVLTGTLDTGVSGPNIWVGVEFTGSVDDRPAGAVVGVDYIRQLDDYTAFVP